MRKLIGILFIGLLNSSVFAQDANLRDPCIFPQRVTMKNATLLQDILKDENVSLKIKTCTLDWVRELYELEEDKAKPHAQEFFGIASNFLDNYKNDGAFTMHEEIRSSSCYLMAALENTGQKTAAIEKTISFPVQIKQALILRPGVYVPLFLALLAFAMQLLLIKL